MLHDPFAVRRHAVEGVPDTADQLAEFSDIVPKQWGLPGQVGHSFVPSEMHPVVYKLLPVAAVDLGHALL